MIEPICERRFKLLYVGYKRVLELIHPERAYQSGKIVITQLDIPEGTKVVSVFSDQVSHSFCYLLYNDAWDILEEGVEPPVHCLMIKQAIFDIVPEESHERVTSS